MTAQGNDSKKNACGTHSTELWLQRLPCLNKRNKAPNQVLPPKLDHSLSERNWSRAAVYLEQRFSKSGLRSGPASTSYFKRTRITQTSVRRAWYTHTHTHTHTDAWSRIMSPVSPHEHEVSPSRRSLSPLAGLAAYSKNQTAADL